MAFNRPASCSHDTQSIVENGEVSDHAKKGGLDMNGVAANESSTDDGVESPESPVQQNFKKKPTARNQEGSSTNESTPDKRECPCELCSGVSNVRLLQGEDRNRNVSVLGAESDAEAARKLAIGASSDEGVPAHNGVVFENGLLELSDHVHSEVKDGRAVSDHVPTGVKDGMELYFRDNVHLLDHDLGSTGASTPEASPRHESLNLGGHVNGVTSWGAGDYVTMTCSSSRHSGMQSSNGYGSDKGSHRCSDYDSDEGGVYVLPDDLVVCGSSKHTALNDSSEDQGDFIEADIPKNPYACSGDSSNGGSRRNSVSSSYEDLRESNICPPNSANRTSGDEETFTKLVFHSDLHRSANRPQEQARASAFSYHSHNVSASPLHQPSPSSGPVLRPTNLFDSRTQSSNPMERSNIMFTSASTESSSPFTMSSAAFMSPSYSDNSTSALNAPTSGSSVFASPEREAAPGASAARRREAFLRNQSMDQPHPGLSQCPLRPAKSSGDIDQGAEDQAEFSAAHSALPMSQSLYQNFGRGGAGGAQTSAMMCRHCNKQHGAEQTMLRRSGSAGVSVVEGNDQSRVVLPDGGASGAALRSNSEELLDGASCPRVVCLSCHRQRFGAFSCDRNDCDVLEQAVRKHQCCLHGRCTCSLAYYFSCVLDGSSDAGTEARDGDASPSQSSHAVDVRPRQSDSGTAANQNSLSRCSQRGNNLSRRVHHYIHHLHNIDNVTRQNTASNFSSDDNYSVHTQSGQETSQSSHNSPVGVLGNLPEISGGYQPENQENENNDNIENGRALMQNACGTSQAPAGCSAPRVQASTSEQLQRDRGMREVKARGELDYSRGRTRSSGIRILPLLLRSANTIDEMDPEAVMELSSMLQNDEESEDDGYVDFQKILKDYMVHKFYEKHSIASQWYSCDLEGHERIDTAMIWTEYQAYLFHARQIGRSACGATAAINVLKAFDLDVDQETVCDVIRTKLRDETAAVPEYLLSRSVAGTTAEELIRGVETLTGGRVYGRFFHMHPLRRVCIRKWLSGWIRKGAVPLLTLNLQKAVPSGYSMPDAWHHQMVFGVGQQGVFLTNPQEIVPEHVIMAQLSSDSVLLVQRHDVVSRWPQDGCDLGLLMRQEEPRWRTFNVIGQIVNVLREEKLPHHMGFRPQLTDYVRIPVTYRCGVTLFVKADNSYCQHLRTMPELEVRTDWGEKLLKRDKT